MFKNYAEVTEEVVEEVVETAEETELEVAEEAKPSFKDRAKGVFNTVKNSKAAKIVGGVALVTVGAVGALALAGKRSDDSDVYDVDINIFDTDAAPDDINQ